MKTKFPTLEALIHPHTKTLPPPCFTVGHKFCFLNALFGFLQTLTLPSDENKLNFDSSVKRTDSQNVCGSLI